MLEHWEGFITYLEIEKKQAHSNTKRVWSCFHILATWFEARNLDFTRDNFNLFISYLRDQKYSLAYINTFIKFAKHLDVYLKTNQLSDYSYFKEPEKVTECLTVEEVTRLANCKMKYVRLKREKSLRMRALIFFLGCVGSRITETLLLTQHDLLYEKEPMVYFRPETTKTGKGRYCVIPHWLYNLMAALPKTENELLFGLDKTIISEDLEARALRCGIRKRVYPHVFRHSSINNKLEAGMPLEMVTAYHGHSSTTTTYKYYVHIQQKQMADVLFMYDPFFKQGLTFEMVEKRVKQAIEKIIDPDHYKYTWTEDNHSFKFVCAPIK